MFNHIEAGYTNTKSLFPIEIKHTIKTPKTKQNKTKKQFPPLPANVLEMDDVSAYDVAKANVNLALDFAKSFATTGSTGKVAVLLPDED